MIIYKATNIVNGKVYIGKTTTSLHIRKQAHFRSAFKKESNYYFHKALRKYGKDSFYWEILYKNDNILINDLGIIEQYYITLYKSFYDNGYNMTLGGSGPTGWVPTKETREKISNANKGCIPWNKGIPLSQETKNKMSKKLKGRSAWNKGKKGVQVAWNKGKTNIELFGEEKANRLKMKNSECHKGKKASLELRRKLSKLRKGHRVSIETRLKISKRLKNRVISEEQRKKISKTLTGYKHSEETKKKLKGRIPWNKGKKFSDKKIKNKDKLQQMQIAV
jgi:group I intron endonuclease